MYILTTNYGDVVRLKAYPEIDIDELTDDFKTYNFLDELLQYVKQNLEKIYINNLRQNFLYKSFYAIYVDDNSKVLKVHEFAIETKIKRVKIENVSEDYILEDDDISEGWSREYE